MTTTQTIKVRTGSAREHPNTRIKSTSASLSQIASSTLVNGTVAFEAYDHNNGRRIYVDFCSPYQTITPVQTQADRMREMAETLLREAERLEGLIEKARNGTASEYERVHAGFAS